MITDIKNYLITFNVISINFAKQENDIPIFKDPGI